MHKVIYTAILGQYDRLNPIPSQYREGWKAICYTDQDFGPDDGWMIKNINSGRLCERAASKRVKILSHEYIPDADLSIWIDGSVKIRRSLDEFIGCFGQDDFVVIRHPSRNCVYSEMKRCVGMKKVDSGRIFEQRMKYFKERYPYQNGLYKAGILLRRPSARVQNVEKLWWNLTEKYGNWRDQITLPLAFWKGGFRPRVIPNNEVMKFFAVKPHCRGLKKVA